MDRDAIRERQAGIDFGKFFHRHDKVQAYKIPRYIRFVTEFPLTITGKVQKFGMRERMILELGLSEQKTA